MRSLCSMRRFTLGQKSSFVCPRELNISRRLNVIKSSGMETETRFETLEFCSKLRLLIVGEDTLQKIPFHFAYDAL